MKKNYTKLKEVILHCWIQRIIFEKYLCIAFEFPQTCVCDSQCWLFFPVFQPPRTMRSVCSGSGCAPGSARVPCGAGCIRLMGTSSWPPTLDNQHIAHTAETLYGMEQLWLCFLCNFELGSWHAFLFGCSENGIEQWFFSSLFWHEPVNSSADDNRRLLNSITNIRIGCTWGSSPLSHKVPYFLI